MSACTQPGCSGSIVDGYCDICGSPGAEQAAAATGPTPSAATTAPTAASAAADGTRCSQPGCSGTIADGYCDVCGTPGFASTDSGGSAPAAAAPAPPSATPTDDDATVAAALGSTPTTGSASVRLDPRLWGRPESAPARPVACARARRACGPPASARA